MVHPLEYCQKNDNQITLPTDHQATKSEVKVTPLQAQRGPERG
jgi:hypothetical protein